MMLEEGYSLGVFFGTDQETEMLARKFVGNLINHDDFCKACESLEQNVKCDHCRENLNSYASNILFYEKIGENLPNFIEEPEEYLPKKIPETDFLLIIGIHQDLLSVLPEYLKDKKVKAVIIPIEDPKWVPPGLQVQILKEFEKYNIQAAFPKPFCALTIKSTEFMKEGFNITKDKDNIAKFINYFNIGVPIISFLLDKDRKTIIDSCVIQSAPCGSTYFIVQQLKAKYIDNGALSLNERISKAHHSYPCNASMDQDPILKDSILHIGGYLVRNEIRKKLNLSLEVGPKLVYIIK